MKCAKPVVMGIKTRCLLYVPSYANSLAKPTAQKMVGGESSFPSHSTPDGICVTHAKSHAKHPLQFLPYPSNPRPLVTFNGIRIADYTSSSPLPSRVHLAIIPHTPPSLNPKSKLTALLISPRSITSTSCQRTRYIPHGSPRDIKWIIAHSATVFQLSTSMIPSFIRGKYIVYSSYFLPMTSYQNDTALITVECHASSPLHL
jgi:hypothetical protein